MQSKSNQGSRNTMYLWMTVGLISLGRVTLVDAERLNKSNVSDKDVDSLAGYGDSKLISNKWYNPNDKKYESGSATINDKEYYELYEDDLNSYSSGKIERRNPSPKGRVRGGIRGSGGIKGPGGIKGTGGKGGKGDNVGIGSTGITGGNGNRNLGFPRGTGRGTGIGGNNPGPGSVFDISPKKKPGNLPQPPAAKPTGVKDQSNSTPVRDLNPETGANKPKSFTEKAKGYGKDATDALDTIEEIYNHPVTQGIKDSIYGDPEEITDPSYSGSDDESFSEVEPETQAEDTELPEKETEVRPESEDVDVEEMGY